MTIIDTAAAVLIGNMLTVLFVWGAYHAFTRKEEDIPWSAYGAMILPVGIGIAGLVGAGAFPF